MEEKKDTNEQAKNQTNARKAHRLAFSSKLPLPSLCSDQFVDLKAAQYAMLPPGPELIIVKEQSTILRDSIIYF